MPPSPIELLRINTSTSAHSKLSTPVSMLKTQKEPEMEEILPLWSCMPRDLKISPLSKRLEMSSEFTELSLDCSTIKDNSMLVFSITVHGHSFQLNPMKTSHTSTQAKLSILKSMKELSLETLRNGLINTFKTTMLLPMICTFHSTKSKQRKATLTV